MKRYKKGCQEYVKGNVDVKAIKRMCTERLWCRILIKQQQQQQLVVIGRGYVMRGKKTSAAEGRGRNARTGRRKAKKDQREEGSETSKKRKRNKKKE